MTVPIDKTMRTAIARAAEYYGGQSALGRKTGAEQRSISRYISGCNYRMASETWQSLYPYVKEFLPAEKREDYDPETVAAIASAPVMLKSDFDRPDAEVKSANGRKFRAVPVLSFAQPPVGRPGPEDRSGVT